MAGARRERSRGGAGAPRRRSSLPRGRCRALHVRALRRHRRRARRGASRSRARCGRRRLVAASDVVGGRGAHGRARPHRCDLESAAVDPPRRGDRLHRPPGALACARRSGRLPRLRSPRARGAHPRGGAGARARARRPRGAERRDARVRGALFVFGRRRTPAVAARAARCCDDLLYVRHDRRAEGSAPHALDARRVRAREHHRQRHATG